MRHSLRSFSSPLAKYTPSFIRSLRIMLSFVVAFSSLLLLLSIGHVAAFSSVRVASFHQPIRHQQRPLITASFTNKNSIVWVLQAGGFEWEDPGEAFDQGVENPFKNAQLMKNSEEGMKIDAARLLGPRLGGTNLYFVGMMGTGKSTVGNIVARRMGNYNFLDLDEIIEKATGMTIPEIFEAEGEESFRKVEAQILDSVHAYVRCVISTGGGIVVTNQNWSKLQTGIVVWLDVDPEIIMERIKGTDRPLLQTDDPLQTLKDLMEKRKEKYGQADVRIEVTKDMKETDVADLVIRELHNFIDDNPPAWKLAKAKAQAEGLDWV